MITSEQKIAVLENLKKAPHIDAMQLSRFAHIDWHIVSDYLCYLERIGLLIETYPRIDGMTQYKLNV